LQDWQGPQLAAVQQAPSTQLLLAHSLPAAHAAPGDFLPHEPPVQVAGAAQSASPLQLPRQALPSQRKGAQLVVAPATQVPEPLQVDAAVKELPPAGQAAGLHTEPAAYLRQLPWPSHLPSFPQLAAPASVQMPAGSLAPASTRLQRPGDPGRLQDRQAPLQALSQQTPWAQKPDSHSPPAEQAPPFVFLPHEPPWHEVPAEHPVLAVQDSKHRAPLQAYGSQLTEAPAMQLPPPSQWEACL
jgi:hypothetical protein